MLKKYISLIEKKNIPYFWNKKNNLIGTMNDSTQQNIVNRLKRVVVDIDRHVDDDPLVIAKYLRKYSTFEKCNITLYYILFCLQ